MLKEEIEFETKRFKFIIRIVRDRYPQIEVYLNEGSLEGETIEDVIRGLVEIVSDYLKPLGKWEKVANPLGMLCNDIGLTKEFEEKFITTIDEWKLKYEHRAHLGSDDAIVCTPNHEKVRVERLRELKDDLEGIAECVKNIDKWYMFVNSKTLLKELYREIKI